MWWWAPARRSIHPFVGDVEHHPFAGDEKTGDARLWEISPLVDCPNDTVGEDGYPEPNKAAIASGKWEILQDHFITRGVPAALLSEGVVGGSFYTYRVAGEVLVKSGAHPVVAVKPYGKGRVVAPAYVEEGFLPQAADPVDTRVQWTTGNMSTRCWPVRSCGRRAAIRAATVTSFRGRDGGRLPRAGGGSPPRSRWRSPGRTSSASPWRRITRWLDPKAGDNVLPVPAEALRPATGLPPGKLIFDLIVRDAAGATLDWASATFDAALAGDSRRVKPSADVYRQEDTLRAVARAEGDLSGLQVRFRVIDDYDRLLVSQERPAAAREEFTYRLADFLGQFALLSVELVDAHGFVVDRLETKPFLVTPKQRRRREYAARIGFSSLRPYFRAVRLRQIRAASTETGMTWTEGINNGLDVPRGSFGIYWYDRGPEDAAGIEKCIQEYQRTGDIKALPYNARKALFQRTHDKKLLVRNPSFSDPAFLEDSAKARARQRPRESPLWARLLLRR